MYKVESFDIQIKRKQIDIFYLNKLVASSICFLYNESDLKGISSVPFLRIAKVYYNFHEGYGSFPITETIQDMSVDWEIESVHSGFKNRVELKGFTRFKDCSIQKYTIWFYLASPCQLGFKIELDDPIESIKTNEFHSKSNKWKSNIILTLKSHQQESFYGCGEQLGRLNLKGHYVPIIVREDGIGRGLQPVYFIQIEPKFLVDFIYKSILWTECRRRYFLFL